jgi:hypothetical protein
LYLCGVSHRLEVYNDVTNNISLGAPLLDIEAIQLQSFRRLDSVASNYFKIHLTFMFENAGPLEVPVAHFPNQLFSNFQSQPLQRGERDGIRINRHALESSSQKKTGVLV